MVHHETRQWWRALVVVSRPMCASHNTWADVGVEAPAWHAVTAVAQHAWPVCTVTGSGHTAAVLVRAAWHRVAWRAVTAVDHAMRQQTATGHLRRQSLWPASGGRLEPSNSTKRPFFSLVIFHFNHDAIQELKARATCCTAVPFTSGILHTEIYSRERTIASLN